MSSSECVDNSSVSLNTVTSNTKSSRSFILTGENLGSFVEAEIAASINASDNFFTASGYPIQPRNPALSLIVTKTPALKLNF